MPSPLGLRPRKYSSSAPGLEIGSNVGFGMKRLTLPPTSSRCLPSISAHCIGALAMLRLDVAGEGVDRLVVVVVAVEVLEVDLAHGGFPLARLALPASLRNPCGAHPAPRRYCRACRTTPCVTTSTCSTATGTRRNRTTTGRGCASTRPSTTTRRATSGRSPSTTTCSPSRRTPRAFSSYKAPRPHGEPLPMMISMDNPLHQRRRSLVYHGFTPKRVAEHEARIREHLQRDRRPRVRARRVRLRVGRRRAAPAAAHRRHARLRAERVRRPAALVRRPHPRHHRRAHAGDREPRRWRPSLGFRELQLERDRRPAVEAAAVRPHLAALPRRGRRRAARRRVDRAGDAAHPHRRRRDHASRHHRRAARAVRAPRPVRRSCATTRRRCRPASRRCCAGSRRSRTCRAPSSTTSSCAGETLHAGDQVILMYPSANRDADEFPDPFTFDVRRDPNHHIAFGFGPHYCLGQALARLELNVMFDVLFRRLPDLEPANDEPLPYRASQLHRRPRGHARAVHADAQARRPLPNGSDSFQIVKQVATFCADADGEGGPCTRCRQGRQEVVLAFDSGQAPLRHTRGPAESCFLPDLTRFTGSRCAGPDPQRLVRVVPLGGPSLEREFSPPDVGLGYRAPRAPRLARSTGEATRRRVRIDAPWRGARAAESARLESVCGATHRGFESHSLRQPSPPAEASGRAEDVAISLLGWAERGPEAERRAGSRERPGCQGFRGYQGYQACQDL